jgi:hypothetical protein
MLSDQVRGLAYGVVAVITLGVSSHAKVAADPQPYGPDTCAQGYVWREAIPSDHVCVTPDVRSRTQQENAAAPGLRDPNGAYGSNSCKPGYVWRNAFNGDAVCVTPNIRDEVAGENAAASSHVAHQPPAQQPAQQSMMVWKATGHGETYNIVIDDGKSVQTLNAEGVPFSRTEVMTVKAGAVYQIVVSGRGDAKVGCEINYQDKVVAQQPVNNSAAHCVWNAP